MGALMMGLGGFVLGLFFGWLLQRKRVDRATQDASVREHEQAIARLTDTSARLELADRDVVGLRAQLTDARHLLDEREATIARLTEELAACRGAAQGAANGVVAPPSKSVDAAADAATTPPMAQLFADEAFDDEDITEEVFVAPRSPDPEPAAEALPDDLKRIVGVGPALERMLHDQGITTFRQLALLDDNRIDELQARLPRFSDRIRRGRWVEQARTLHLEMHGDAP